VPGGLAGRSGQPANVAAAAGSLSRASDFPEALQQNVPSGSPAWRPSSRPQPITIRRFALRLRPRSVTDCGRERSVRGQEHRPARALADGQVDRPGGARRQRDRDDLAALRVMVSVRCPRSRPRCSMSAPAASETRSPFRASSEISACSVGGPSPAATSNAPDDPHRGIFGCSNTAVRSGLSD
jgi:hypothetical protein